MMKFPDIKGRIPFEGVQAAKFWIRTFGLEVDLDFIQAKIMEKPQGTTASVPIVNEYIVDEENLRFYFAMHLKVDALGIQDAIGMVYYSDRKNAEMVLGDRDQLANRMLDTVKERQERDEGFEVEMHVRQPGKET